MDRIRDMSRLGRQQQKDLALWVEGCERYQRVVDRFFLTYAARWATACVGSLRPARHRLQVTALEPPAATGTAGEPLAAGTAPPEVVEEHPIVLPPDPPELPPDLVFVLARTTQRDHRLISPRLVSVRCKKTIGYGCGRSLASEKP